MWKVYFTKNAEKDQKLLKAVGLDNKAKNIIKVMAINPFAIPPGYEKLKGKLNGYYSRRINIQHRIVYRVDEDKHAVIISSMWTHYE